MKKNKIKLLSVFLSSLTVFSNVFPVFAYNTDEYNNSIEEISYQNNKDEDFSNTTSVFAQIGSEYKVTIPKTVVLNGELKFATYKVKTEGDIAGDEYIEVIPDKFFNLYTKNKDPQIANIYQDKTIWTIDEFDILADGYINAPTITAGKWKGTFNFYISLNSSRVLGDIILPPNLDDDYRLKISKIKDNPGIYDDDGILILPWPEIETRTEGGETIPEIINSTPGGTGLSIPEGTTRIPEDYIKGTDINIIYIPPTVRDIGPHFADGTNINIICLGPITNTTPETFGGLPEDTQIYIGGKPVGPDININIETLPESPEEIKDEEAIVLEKGCIYQITALYNFINDVTKKSTIKSSNPDIVKFIPDCTLEALEVGTSIISGQYNGPNGLKNAYILVKVIDSDENDRYYNPSGHKHTVSALQTENIVPATCLNNGQFDWVFYCTDCGKELGRRTIITNKTNHSYKGTIITKPTCVTNGTEKYVCKTCEQEYTSVIKALGHNFVNNKCTRCGKEVVYYSSKAPGLYDDKTNIQIMSWEELINAGVNFTKDYTTSGKGPIYVRLDKDAPANFFKDNNLGGKIIIGDIPRLGNSVFRECDTITEVLFSNPSTKLGEACFEDNQNLEYVELPKNLTEIPNYTFCYTGIKSLYIPNNVSRVGIGAIYRCNELNTMTFANANNWYYYENGTYLYKVNVNTYNVIKELVNNSYQEPNGMFVECSGAATHELKKK